MSHTNNYAKYDPYVAEIASKVDNLLEQYDDVLGNVQIPFNVGLAMVKAHERGLHSKFENDLMQYQLYTSRESPYNPEWEWTKAYYIHQDELRATGRKMTNWFEFSKYMKEFLGIFNQKDSYSSKNKSWHNIQVAYYEMIDR